MIAQFDHINVNYISKVTSLFFKFGKSLTGNILKLSNSVLSITILDGKMN